MLGKPNGLPSRPAVPHGTEILFPTSLLFRGLKVLIFLGSLLDHFLVSGSGIAYFLTTLSTFLQTPPFYPLHIEEMLSVISFTLSSTVLLSSPADSFYFLSNPP